MRTFAGLFAGLSLEGTVLIERKDANKDFYGSAVPARDILSGRVPPPEVASRLYEVIEAAEGLADGVEGRLDDLIGNLDDLLGVLEGKAGELERACEEKAREEGAGTEQARAEGTGADAVESGEGSGEAAPK